MVQFEEAIQRALREPIEYDNAWALFSGASSWSKALELFSTASRLRDEVLGNELTLYGHLGMVTSCPLTPACKYCSVSSIDPGIGGERIPFTVEQIAENVEYMEKRGMSSVVLVGGTRLEGLDAQVRDVVTAVRERTDIDLTINVGPSLSVETLHWLKNVGVKKINCSLETINPTAFEDAKPSDDLRRRITLMEAIEKEEMKLGTIVMAGLGGLEDLIRSILYLRRFRNVDSISISRFTPIAGTPWADRTPASILDSFKAMSIARLAFPDSRVGLAFGGGVDLIPHQLMAGAGNNFMGIMIDRKKKQDNVARIKQFASDLGFKLVI